MKQESLEDLRGFLKIDRLNLQEEMVRQPALFSRCSEIYQLQWNELSRARLTLSKVEAALDQRVRMILQETRSSNDQWIMKEEVISAIHREPAWIEANEAVIEAQSVLGQVAAIRDAFVQRASMLVSLSGLMRQELVGLGSPLSDRT